jgi:hypothetical protein
MAGFVYNPAESIRQDFQEAGSAMGNIFAQVIQQQQRDYNLAENTFANIEALKKDLNIYGQKSITAKANTLLGNASQAILANGKLDYGKLGEIRQAVSDIKDLKTGYDLGSKEYERMLQIGLANKENLTSFEGFYKDLSAKMSDENLIKNPRDLQAALADTYAKSLDATKMFTKSFVGANPYQPLFKEVKDAKGNLIRIQGELPVGWDADVNGKLIPPAPVTIQNADGTTSTIDYADRTVAQLKATNPDVLAAMRRQSGFAGQNLTDKELVEFYTTKVPMSAKPQQIASADELKAKELAVKTAQVNLNYLPAEKELDIKYKKAMINAANRKNIDYNNPEDLASNGVEEDNEGNIIVNYGKNVMLPSAQVYNPTTKLLEKKPFVVVNRRILANGDQQLIGFVPPAGMTKLEAMEASFAPKDLIITPLNKTNYTSLKSVFVSKQFNKELADRNSIAESLASSRVKPIISAAPKGQAPTKPSTQFRGLISKSKLSSMYGEGKDYPNEASAAKAAIELGYKVEGYN